jgi:LemA protein
MTNIWIIWAVFVGLIILIGILIYNRIIKAENNIEKSFGSVDVMLKKRYDLIPNLVETVKAYMIHEATVFEEVTRLRTGAEKADKIKDKVEQYNKIEERVKDIMFNVENYPDLKASKNFLSLQASWNVTEENISAARRYYNSAVTAYNNQIEVFPNVLIAKMFAFKPAEVFVIPEAERKNVDAKTLFAS